MPRPCPYGTHRVLEPEGVLPQAAWRLDNTPRPLGNEVLLKARTLNIDAASFTQLEESAGGDESRIAGAIADIVARRGKMHNPVTGSGGVLVGDVAQVGAEFRSRRPLAPGDRVVTLVSLSLTPLHLERVTSVNRETDQVEVEGHAILFQSGIWTKLPDDLPEKVAMAVLDVAGAPAQMARLVRPGDRVLVLGAGGKSGLLCLYEARKRAGVTGQVIGLGHSPGSTRRIADSGLADVTLQGDASRPLEILRLVEEATGGKPVDLAVNCVNIPGTEMSTILPVRDGGTAYFFSMATSFTAAALGAEGVGKDVTLIIGNGYCRDHDAISLNLLRESPALGRIFEELFG